MRTTCTLAAMAAPFLAATANAQPGCPRFHNVGLQEADHFGTVVASVGDVDGDGADDWAVSAPEFDRPSPGGGFQSNTGRVWVYSGRTGSLIYQLDGDGGQYFGLVMTSAGDTDGDGRPDILVGSRYANAIWLFSGANGAIRYQLSEPLGNDNFGSAVAGLDDIDRDGFTDFAVGQVLFNPDTDGSTDVGRVRFYSGIDGTLIDTIDGTFPGEQLGFVLANIGDVSGDGLADLAVSEWRTDASVHVFDAATRQLIRTLPKPAGLDGDFGFSMAGVGDLDGDFVPDLAVASPSLWAGAVVLFSGASWDVIDTLTPMVTNPYVGGRFGASVAAAGDLERDGIPDLLIGAPDTVLGPSGGTVVVVSGSARTALLRIDGQASGDQLGFSVASLGDVNGDGFQDFVVGAPRVDVAEYDAGRALLYLATPADLTGEGCVDVFDLLVFLDDWFAGEDWDRDGLSDVFDLLVYLDLWFQAGS